ncbi:hypothetical protein FA13DRAFT_1764573 [Coprinellus micaceus]|uniref:Peroxisome membrane anchor protein Pex14p N-terminal domain-containing protein n=1 Tax=Coprinellus micaceus TaxID=71717 RepID=A0A4Y7T913_COPMI|nr:hypothetical protein FA13DRAFT_1764573 [Coprinellus micaceus]
MADDSAQSSTKVTLQENKAASSTSTVPASPEATPPVASVSQETTPSAPSTQSRDELISRARAFLHSPQIQNQDVFVQRRFLVEKGLSETEINGLLSQASAPKLPAIPPRNYPQPPPSNLPTLLLGLARLFSWIGIGSAALVFVYYRFLLPKLIKTAQARKALRTHHLSLMARLNDSIAATREAQSQDYASLPRADPYRERSPYLECRSVSQVLKKLGEKEPDYASLPPVTLLRCAIADLSKGKAEEEADPTAEEILRVLEGRIPWLLTDEGYKFKKSIYDTLVSCPHFVEEAPSTASPPLDEPIPLLTWRYVKPPRSEPSPTVQSLDQLSSTMPVKPSEPRPSPFTHLIESLSEFTWIYQ